MGYSTEFQGRLEFTRELKASELALLGSMMGEDCRDHPEWGEGLPGFGSLNFVHFRICRDFGGIEWDGSEKAYGTMEIVNLITHLMRKQFPDFQLKGIIHAQGEDFDDRWELRINSVGTAYQAKLELKGKIIECPNCEQKFEGIGPEFEDAEKYKKALKIAIRCVNSWEYDVSRAGYQKEIREILGDDADEYLDDDLTADVIH
jgi:hypothetical protein